MTYDQGLGLRPVYVVHPAFGEYFTELGLSRCQNGEEVPHCFQGSEHEGGSGWVEMECEVGRKGLYGFRVR